MEKKFSKIILITLLFALSASSCEEKPEVTYSNVEGFYSCNENSPYSGYRKYIVEIEKVKSSENLYIISNFHNLGDNEFLFAELLMDTLYIKDQAISNLVINGKGAVNEDFTLVEMNYLTFDYMVELDFYANYER